MNRLQRIISFLLIGTLSWVAQGNNELPDIGTAAATTLSIDKEIQYGEAYMRAMRATQPITQDPVLSEYISTLGHRIVASADSVRTPFNFFLITNNEINAAAFLGGYVKVHTGLFLYAESESELASVLAHEVAHVTQRHIARSIENSASSQNLSVAGVIGSVLLGIANPVAGIAALHTTIAASAQNSINYTRQNEFEADRIGLQTLYRAGFEAQGMGEFFGRLADKYRYANQKTEMLQTHPLPDTRVNEARARAAQFPNRYVPPGFDFQLAKARIQVRYSHMNAQGALSYFENQLSNRTFKIEDAALYGKALALFGLKRFSESRTIIDALSATYSNNLFILDTLSDLDLAQDAVQPAIERLESANELYPDNVVVVMNLAAAYSQAKQYQKAADLLDLYTRRHPDYSLAWRELSEYRGRLGQSAEASTSRAEYLALRANYSRAIEELRSASNLTESKLDRTRIDARIEQLQEAERAMKDMKK
jgi:predicted Zn-dependent protease